MAFDSSGRTVAIASSYNNEKGEVAENPPDKIYIKRVGDTETKPKMI